MPRPRGLTPAIILILLAVVAACTPKSEPKPEAPARAMSELTYTFEVTDQGDIRLKTSWSSARPSEQVMFWLCGGGWSDIYDCSDSFQLVENARVGQQISEPGNDWLVDLVDNTGNVTFTYAKSAKPSMDTDVFRRAMVTDNWLHLVGHTALPVVRSLGPGEQIRVTIDADKLKEHFGSVLISWEPGKSRVQRVAGNEDIGKLLIVAGGKPIEHRLKGKQRIFEVDLFPGGSAFAHRLGLQAQAVMETYLKYYHSTGIQQSLVFVPVSMKAGAPPMVDGITLPGIISLMLPEDPARDDAAHGHIALKLLAHELGHNWIGQTLRAGAAENELAWFIEGFTDYLTRKMLFRSGIYKLEDYLKDLNESVGSYLKDPNRTLSNLRLVERRKAGQADLQETPYRRGDMFALWLDQHLPASDPLHSRLRGLLDDPKTHDLEADSLFEYLAQPLSEADKDTFLKMVHDGEPVSLTPSRFAPCLVFRERQKKAAGFTLAPKADAAACADLL